MGSSVLYLVLMLLGLQWSPPGASGRSSGDVHPSLCWRPDDNPGLALSVSLPSVGVLRESHRHLDGRVSALRLLGAAGVRRR